MGTESEKPPKCLVCDNEARRRGLCQKHYSSYRRSYLSLPLNLREKFENGLIESGKLAGSRFGGKLEDDEFADFAKEVLKESVSEHDLREVDRQSRVNPAKKAGSVSARKKKSG